MKANLDPSTETTGASSRPRRLATAALVGLLALTACTSDPGPTRVAKDIVEAEFEKGEITEVEKDCMFDVLADDYDESDLEDIAGRIASTDASNVAEGEAELEQLRTDLSTCTS